MDDRQMDMVGIDGLVSDWSNVATVRKVAKPNPPVLKP